MPGVSLPLGLNTSAATINWCTEALDSSWDNAEITIAANPALSVAKVAGIRFVLPPTITKDNIRQATLQFSGGSNTDDANDLYCMVVGHKVANSGYFTPGSTMPVSRLANRTIAEVPLAIEDLPATPKIASVASGGSYQLVDILKEIMNVPGWGTTTRAITLLLRGSTAGVNKMNWWITAAGDPQYQPRLNISYGTAEDEAIDFDLGFFGDSHSAYPGQAGYPSTFTVLPVVLGTITVEGCIGMRSPTGGIEMYGGDNIRGWTDQGYVQDSMEAKWGGGVEVFRGEFAIAGTLAAQWGGQLDQPNGGWWGDPTVEGTLRHRIRNPLSPSGNQLWICTAGGNDVVRYGTEHLIHSPVSAGATSEAAVAAEWDLLIEATEPLIRRWLDEFFDNASYSPHPERVWLYNPGYPNFPVLSAGSASPLRMLPNANGQDFFRAVHMIEGFGIASRQWQFDANNDQTGHYDSGLVEHQSSKIQSGAFYQQIHYPGEIPPGNEYNPNAEHWPEFYLSVPPGLPVNYPFPGETQHSTWLYAGHDLWQIGARYINDITINRRFHQVIDTLWNMMQRDYPNVIYRPSWNLLPVDTLYSADPTSEFAQPPADLYVEGIHPNMDGLDIQWNAPGGQLDQIAMFIPFLQPTMTTSMFSEWDGSTERPVSLEGMWDGTTLRECHFANVVP